MATRKGSYGAIAKVGGGMIVFGFIVTIMHAVEVAVCVVSGFIVGAILMSHIAVIRYKDWDDME